MNPLFSRDVLLFSGVFLVGLIVAILYVKTKKTKTRTSGQLVELLTRLTQHPLDVTVRREFWQTALSVGKVDTQTSARTYRTVLNILATNPYSAEIKELALDMGIWHYSRLRLDKKPTTQDEVAILDDILACTRVPMPRYR